MKLGKQYIENVCCSLLCFRETATVTHATLQQKCWSHHDLEPLLVSWLWQVDVLQVYTVTSHFKQCAESEQLFMLECCAAWSLMHSCLLGASHRPDNSDHWQAWLAAAPTCSISLPNRHCQAIGTLQEQHIMCIQSLVAGHQLPNTRPVK